MKTFMKRWAGAAIGLFLSASIYAASTPGSATVTVAFTDLSGGYSARVDAFWVTDAANNFVQNVRKDAGSRQRYLYKWTNMTHSYTTIDGYSGATASGTSPVTVTWDCRDINNVVMPDGNYKFYIEFTDRNGQGPWTTNGLLFAKGPVGVTNSYSGQQYMSGLVVTYTPDVPPHDIAVAALSPLVGLTNSLVNMFVTVTNLTTSPESNIVVSLSNLTSVSLIATQKLATLPALSATTLTFPWSTTNLAAGSYQLSARAATVAGETVTANNTLAGTVVLQGVMHDLAVLKVLPTNGFTSSNVVVQVTVTNETATPEPFTLVVSNLTSGLLAGSSNIASLAGKTALTVSLNWSTAGLAPGAYQLQAKAGPVFGEVAVEDNTMIGSVVLRDAFHNLAVLRVTPPLVLVSNLATNVTVLLTNSGDFAESFNVRLYDDTAARLVGSNQISGFPSRGSITRTFSWAATNCALGAHTLRAEVTAVSVESTLADNTNGAVSVVALGWTTNSLIASGDAWKFNDTATDLSDTPWRAPDYYDAVWAAGPGPLGYGYAGLGTTNAFGPDPAHKATATYYRRAFTLDTQPVSAWVRYKRDDGLVVYDNGVEIARNNMPAGAPGFATLAVTNAAGTPAGPWITNTVGLSNVALGVNLIAAEAHQNSADSDGLFFDLEFIALAPVYPQTHDVSVASLSAPGNALAGDRLPVFVTLTNRGSATETVLVVLRDALTGQVLGTQTLAGVGPGQSSEVRFDWATLGAVAGARGLEAFTVVGGVTNSAGAAAGVATVSGSGFGLNAVNAAGTLGGRYGPLAVHGTWLLVGAGATLEVWNCSDGGVPARAGVLRLPGMIEGISAAGNFAFVACGSAGVQFVDLTYPPLPVHRRTFNTSGHAYATAVSGSYLYVADGVSGVRVVDITDPAAPSLAGAFYTEGPARAVQAVGTRVYVLDQHAGLLILDAANPAAPALLSRLGGFIAGTALVVEGTRLYAVDANNQLTLVDVSNPAAPVITGTVVVPNGGGRSLAVRDGVAFYAAGDSGLTVVDVLDPAAPAWVMEAGAAGDATGVALAGVRLFLTTGFAGLHQYDIADPLAPAWEAVVTGSQRVCDVVVSNQFAYVAAGESGLRIFDLSGNPAPALLAAFNGVGNARSVALAGDMVCVGDGQYGLKLVGVTNPAAPVFLGSYTSAALDSIRSVGVSLPWVVLSDGRSLELVNVSVPASPTLAGVWSAPGFAYSLVVAGGRVYAACGNAGMVILNMSAGGLSEAGAYNPGGLVTGVSVSGNRAYLARGTDGWTACDVSNPAAPVLLKDSEAQGPAFDVAAAGAMLALGNGANAAVTLDVSAPLTPVSMAVFGPLVRAARVAATPGFVLAAEQDAGLAVFAASADVDQDGMPDAWEQQIVDASRAAHGSIQSIWDVRPGDDYDGDGLSNLAEYLGGTSPIDGTPRLMLYSPVPLPGGRVTLTWTSIPGKTYTVWKASSLGQPNSFAVLADNIPGNSVAATTAYVDEHATGTAFYIISVR